MTRSHNTMKPLSSKRPISMSLSRTQRQSMRFSAVAGLTTTGDTDSQTTGDSIITPVTEASPTITSDDESNSCTDTVFDAVEFVTVEADWSSFSQTASHPTLSRLPPLRGDVYPTHQRPSIEYIQEFAFPHGVPIDFLDKERAKLLCSSTGDAVHVMRFCDAQGIQKYATCLLVHVSFSPTEDVLKQNLLQLAVSRAAVDIIKRAWLRYSNLLRIALRASLNSTLTHRPGSFKSVQSTSKYSNHHAGGSPRKSSTSIRGLEGLSLITTNHPMSSGFTDSSSSGHTPSPKKRSSKRIHVNNNSSKNDGIINSGSIISSNPPHHRHQHYLDQLNMASGTTAGAGAGAGNNNTKTKNKKKFSYLQRFGTSFRKLVGGTGGATTTSNNNNNNDNDHNNNNNHTTGQTGGDQKLTVNTALPPSVLFSTVSPTHSTTKSSLTTGPPLIYSPMSSNGSTLGGGVEAGGKGASGVRRKRLDGLKMILDRLGCGGLRCGEDDCVAVTQRAYCLVTGQPGHLIVVPYL